jgi:hypothetical protein
MGYVFDVLELRNKKIEGESKMEITKEQFQAYESVRQSGVTNMFDVRTVGMLSGLDRPTIL